MFHRGPDDQGIESKGDATLGVRRLAIFDPANGHQPMRSSDGRYTIVFNGSIINFRELRSDLASHWTFRTECDTEVLLAGYARHGPDFIKRLRGMFAFALWDDLEQTVHLARDPFGIKPLYYRHDGGRLVFASEINALLAGGVAKGEVDPLAVADYLAWFSVPAPRTIYRGIFSLLPGERATFQRGQFNLQSHWSFRSIPRDPRPCASREDFVRELRVRLEDTIRAHTLADVPVGAFLSGGLDSAVVVGLMTRASGERLRTFSIGFEEVGYSEAAQAEATARHFGADHQATILTADRVAGDIEKFISGCDQPTGDGLNTYYASQAARAGGVTVALSGLGGDELFGGYPSFRNLPRLAVWLPRWRRLPRSIRGAVISRLRRGSTRGRKLADVLRYAQGAHELGALQRRVFSEPGRRSLLAPDVLHTLGDLSPFHPQLARLRAELPDAGAQEVASAWELRTYMADLLLRDSDITSMRHSIELRVPFVDRPFIEWLWQQPPEYKFTPLHPKSVLAEATADLLPPGMRRRRKHGFTLPMAPWMRRELKPFLDETFSDASIGHSGLLQVDAVQNSWRAFLKHHDTRDWSRIWSLAVLIAFMNRRQPGPVSAPSPSAAVVLSARPPSLKPILVASNGDSRGLKSGTLLVAPEIFSSVGGIPRMIRIYLKALTDLSAERHSKVRLVALNDPHLDSNDLRRYVDGDLDNWCVCNRNKRRFVRESLRLSRGCSQLVCGHVAQLPVAWMIRLLHPKMRYYLIAHGIEVWRPFTTVERIALRGAERIFCVSEFTRRELLKHCSLRKGRAIIVPNALDPYFKIDPGTPLTESPPVIVTIARLDRSDRYKGVEDLVAAMPAIRAAEPAAQLHVIGQGDDLPRLQGLARQQGLLGHGVKFFGHMEDKNLAEALGSCRLFALPSRKEGFGLVFLEAMARGRPCLGARAGGIPEVITNETGILVGFGNVPEIAAASVAALGRVWDQKAILERARQFSFGIFKNRLARALDGLSIEVS